MSDYEYIRKFAKITIKDACAKNKVNVYNLFNNRVSKEKVKKVRKQLENDIAMLYILSGEDNG